eukprot:5796182-Prymnesium_polylepis.1
MDCTRERRLPINRCKSTTTLEMAKQLLQDSQQLDEVRRDRNKEHGGKELLHDAKLPTDPSSREELLSAVHKLRAVSSMLSSAVDSIEHALHIPPNQIAPGAVGSKHGVALGGCRAAGRPNMKRRG